jgi:hypothetical protein
MTILSDATDALTYVHDTIAVKSSNNPMDYKDFNGTAADRQRDQDLFATQYASFLAEYQGAASTLQDVMASAKTALKLRIGNCEAQSALGYCFIVEKRQSPVWLAGIQGGDHAYLVVGPPAAAKYNDCTTWTDAYICDPWANAVYAASEFTTRMKALHIATAGAGGSDDKTKTVPTSCQLDSRTAADRSKGVIP